MNLLVRALGIALILVLQPITAHAQAFRSASSAISSGGVSATGVEPTGTVQNDVMVALWVVFNGNAPAVPAGWTSLSTQTVGGLQVAFGYIVRGSSAPSMVFTTGQAASRFYELHITSFSGCNTTTPVQASAFGTTGTTTPGHIDPPNNASAGTSVLHVIGGASFAGSATAWVAPANYTIRTTNVASQAGIIASRTSDALTTGAEDPAAFTGAAAGASEWWDGFTVALQGSGAAPTAAPKLTLLGVGGAD
jgi:hypothetical protein